MGKLSTGTYAEWNAIKEQLLALVQVVSDPATTKERLAELDQRERDIAASKEALDSIAAANNGRAAELDAREAAVEQDERVLEEGQQKLADQLSAHLLAVQSHETVKQQLNKFEAELKTKEYDLTGMLDARARELNQRQESLDQRAKDLTDWAGELKEQQDMMKAAQSAFDERLEKVRRNLEEVS